MAKFNVHRWVEKIGNVRAEWADDWVAVVESVGRRDHGEGVFERALPDLQVSMMNRGARRRFLQANGCVL